MSSADLVRQGQHVMTVCNACRYCEAYCPVFPAMEQRLTFDKHDLTYLANLCHNCGECLYACQYAPPHEFGIDLPRTLAEIRLQSYEEHCRPAFLSGVFRQSRVLSAVLLALISAAVVGGLSLGTGRLRPADARGDFYQVMPHDVMVALFVGVALLVGIALVASLVQFWRTVRAETPIPLSPTAVLAACGAALTLRHLHGGGVDCSSAEEVRTPWRRWFHHATLYGFALCFASTSVAAVYHIVFGWRAPYDYMSLPVALGTAGGLGLLAGPAGLFVVRLRRDEALADPSQSGLDTSFIALLFLTSLTGLLLLVLRNGASMPPLLIVHLGCVLALFVTMPYGKFVHGIYRLAALIKFELEKTRPEV